MHQGQDWESKSPNTVHISEVLNDKHFNPYFQTDIFNFLDALGHPSKIGGGVVLNCALPRCVGICWV